MHLRKVFFKSFGCFIEKEYVFKKNINLIFAPNEAGKTTLIYGILALLFGAKKEGVQKQLKASWYSKYLPWKSPYYGGLIEYELNGKLFSLTRDLRFKEGSSSLLNLSLHKDITANFPFDARKERLFLENQLKIAGEVFRKITFFTPYNILKGFDISKDFFF